MIKEEDDGGDERDEDPSDEDIERFDRDEDYQTATWTPQHGAGTRVVAWLILIAVFAGLALMLWIALR